MKLPVEFLDRMKRLLGDKEYEEFLRSYDEPRYYGLRVNTLKISVEEFLKISPFKLDPVPWTRDGFYYTEGENPGKHPYYHAGLYYIQEPSAMLPGAVLDAQPGERVLDLCAAPGGKTVQIAAGMRNKGLLVANDISSDRVKALVKNIELCGVRNAVVTNESPEKLAVNFAGFFDKILVDAPCSGEGMFRKDEEAARSWEKFKCEKCSCMQWDILQNVDKMLKPGGCLVYSTCTFAPEEDEKMIASFLDKYKDYETVEISSTAGIERGRPEWADGSEKLAATVRLWPHKLKGEGHFVAKLRKHSRPEDDITLESHLEKNEHEIDGRNRYSKNLPHVKAKDSGANRIEPFHEFERENFNIKINGLFDIKGDNLYNLPVEFPDFHNLKVAKFGWYIGSISGGRFEPSHSMLLALKKEDIRNVTEFSSGSREVFSYLKGETLMIEGRKGYTAVCVDGYTLGWGKQTGDMLKNLYPKGWRKMG